MFLPNSSQSIFENNPWRFTKIFNDFFVSFHIFGGSSAVKQLNMKYKKILTHIKIILYSYRKYHVAITIDINFVSNLSIFSRLGFYNLFSTLYIVKSSQKVVILLSMMVFETTAFPDILSRKDGLT